MFKERTAWMVSLVLVALLAFVLPRSLAQRDDDYAFVRTLVEIHRLLGSHYVEEVKPDDLRQGAIAGMLDRLDTYTTYIPPARQEEFAQAIEGRFKGIGVELNQLADGRIEVVSPIEGSPAHRAGILAGDVIVAVDGQRVAGRKMDEVIKLVKGPLGTEVKITVVQPGGAEREISVQRNEVTVPTVMGFERRGDDKWNYFAVEEPRVAYVRVSQFTEDTADRLRHILAGDPGPASKPGVNGNGGLLAAGMRGLILDLRWNPGGRLDEARAMVDLFLAEGVIVSVKGRSRPERIERANRENTLPDFPLIILVNRHSASASEVVAGSLQDNRRALVIGQRTFGKGSVQDVVELDGGGQLKMTTAYYYLPSGRLVHRLRDAREWGVNPQIVVDVDEATERAILSQRKQSELFKRPVTQPAEANPAAGQPVDVQLTQALNTMVGLLALRQRDATADWPPATQPATAPAATGPTP